MEISNLSDAEFKTLVIRMLKELNKYLNSIKKIQSEMKSTLLEIKNNLQGKRVSCMKQRIKSIIWIIRKQKNNQSEQQEEKRIQKNEDSISSL